MIRQHCSLSPARVLGRRRARAAPARVLRVALWEQVVTNQPTVAAQLTKRERYELLLFPLPPPYDLAICFRFFFEFSL